MGECVRSGFRHTDGAAIARGVDARDANDVTRADARAARAIVRSEGRQELHDLSIDIQRDQPLAIRVEVVDLEAAGIRIVQIDEAAFREGLPLRHGAWAHYLEWATEAFRLCASGVRDETQIHTHMCYSEFNDVIESIAAMDADVITIETSRSDMELLDAFEAFAYPNEIGPGVYDIHSPRVPDSSEMANLLRKAARRIPAERLWVNPDCGLKTRGWPETEAALVHMVNAARQLRKEWA